MSVSGLALWKLCGAIDCTKCIKGHLSITHYEHFGLGGDRCLDTGTSAAITSTTWTFCRKKIDSLRSRPTAGARSSRLSDSTSNVFPSTLARWSWKISTKVELDYTSMDLKLLRWDSGCVSDGRAVTSSYRGLRFESKHWQIYTPQMSIVYG